MKLGAGSAFAMSVAAFLGGAAWALSNMASANRPHELDSSPWVTLLFLASAALAGRALLLLHRRSRSGSAPAPWWLSLMIAGASAFLVLTVFAVLVAGGTAVEYLRG